MVTLTADTNVPTHHGSSNYDETSLHEDLLLADSLKDLEDLRTQLYSAAEYFELSYTKDDKKQRVFDTLKDYAIKALVNTVDHLGSVTYKINDLVDENVEEVSGTELRVSCIEQRLRTCQDHIDKEGMAQQCTIIDTPKYHKRYILPAGQTMNGCNPVNLKDKGCGIVDDVWFQFRSAARAAIRDNPSTERETPSTIKETHRQSERRSVASRRGRSISPSSRSSRLPESIAVTSSISKKDKRSVSPHRFPLVCSGSDASRATTPKSTRSTTPNPALERQRYLPDAWKSASMRVHDEKEKPKDLERQPSKSKRLFKALLSRRKPKKDDMLYTYLDEY